MADLGNLIVHVDADISGISSSLSQGQQSIKKFASTASSSTKTIANDTGVLNNMLKNSFRYLVLHAIIVKGVMMTAAGAVNSVKSAMNMVESENLFKVSMGNMASAATDWSNTLQQTLGLNAYEVRKNVGVFYNMTTAMGLTKDKAYDVSTGLTKLAYDMSSFYNIPFEDAFTKLQSGITGEIEPLRRLGIIVNENTSKLYAYSHGIAKQGAVLTEQQKVMARYGVIMQTTSTAQGDLARTLSSPMNQARLLGVQIQLLSINIGRIFMPVIQAVIPLLNQLIGTLSAGANAAANFMESLLGVDYSGATASTDALSTSQNDLATNTDKATKAAKNSLATFDQLNILPDNSSISSGVTTPSSTSGSNPASKTRDLKIFDDLQVKIQEIIDTLIDPRIQKAVSQVWDGFTNHVSGVIAIYKGVYQGISDGIEKFISENKIRIITDSKELSDNVITTILNITSTYDELAKDFNEVIIPVMKKLQPIIADIVDNGLTGMYNILMPIEKFFTGIYKNLSGIMKDFFAKPIIKQTMQSIADYSVIIFDCWKDISGVFKDISGPAGAALTLYFKVLGIYIGGIATAISGIATGELTVFKTGLDGISTVVKTIKSIFENLYIAIGVFFQSTWNNIVSIFSTIGKWFNDRFTEAYNNIVKAFSVVGIFFQSIWDGIVKIFSPIVTWFGQVFTAVAVIIYKFFIAPVLKLFGDLWNGMVFIFSVVGKWFGDRFNEAWNGIVFAFSVCAKFFTDIWNGIVKIFTPITKWFGDIFKGAWDGVTKAFSAVGSFFKGIFDDITKIFSKIGTSIGDTISGAFKSVVNAVFGTVTNVINGFINSINTVTGFLVKISGVKINPITPLKIPKFDVGSNYVPYDMLAIVHEGERITPKSQNPYKNSSSIVPNNNDTSSDTPIQINLYLGNTLVDTIITKINRKNRLNGKPVLQL